MKTFKRLFVPAGIKDHLRRRVLREHKNSEELYYKYLYIIHLLYTHATLYKEDYDKYGVPLYSEILTETIGRRDKARLFFNLQKWEYITLTKNYFVGKHSKHYKLNEQLECARYSIVNVSTSTARFINKILKDENRNDNRLMKQQRSILQNNIELSHEGLDFISSKYPEAYNVVEAYKRGDEIDKECLKDILIEPVDIILFSFLLKDFFVKRPDKESRVYSNLTSLKREYRNYLLLDGKPIYMTDLVNSQMLFSVPVIFKHMRMKSGKRECVIPDDFFLYKELAEKGLVYEAIAERAGYDLNDDTRKLFKQRFFKEIFFSEVSKRMTKVKKAFIELFPSVVAAINSIKANDYTEFPVRLQRMEASVMLAVLGELYKERRKALSIHDCIVVNNAADLKRAEELVKEELWSRYGVKAKFKSETPNA